MRITNKMMTNNMMSNINRNKLNMTALEQQYSTGKKIQKPSEDPIIAVRALKLRTNLSELEQYYEKNIPDAKSWMDVTESALNTVNGILSSVNTYCVQGSTDTLTANDRSAIVENLEQLKQQIYQEGNSNYAGRYVFTGFKTDSSLIFTEDAPNLSYDITENFTGQQIQIINRTVGGYDLSDFVPTQNFEEAPKYVQGYRLQLSYDKLSETKPDSIEYTIKDSNGNMVTESIPITRSCSLEDEGVYTPASGEVNYIHETGEIILGEEIYQTLRTAVNINTTYTKTGFRNGELKPEHYFNCVMTDSKKPEQDPIEFTKETQQIQYEVNFNQKLTINTEGSAAFSHTVGRTISDIMNAVNEVIAVENIISEVKNRLSDTSLTESDKARYEKMKQQLDTELELKKEVMQNAFERGITVSSKEQDRVNIAVADLGSRYVRLELTEDRLSSQKVDFEDLLSKNEDADIAETIIKYSAAETIYNASLSAASKVVQSTLLDFL